MSQPLTIRWQMGPFPPGMSWRVLRDSITLMRRLEPSATLIVSHQGEVHERLDGVRYEYQREHGYEGDGREGRHFPKRFALDEQEVWMDNDHIQWALPDGWIRWRERTDNCALIYDCRFGYHGSWNVRLGSLREKAGGLPCGGMWGLPPGVVFDNFAGRGDGQEEMGFVAYQLLTKCDAWEVVREEWEVPMYQPKHMVFGPARSVFGSHGVHLIGLNRGWNDDAESALDRIEKEHGL